MGSAANVFTGGIASTISSLSRYATATNTLVQDYENRTQRSDFNRTIQFDDPNLNRLKLEGGVLVAVFTGGKEILHVLIDGQSRSIKESMIVDVQRAGTVGEAPLARTPYRFTVRTGPGKEQTKIAYGTLSNLLTMR